MSSASNLKTKIAWIFTSHPPMLFTSHPPMRLMLQHRNGNSNWFWAFTFCRGRKDLGNEKFVIMAYTVFDPETFQMLFRGVPGMHMELVGKAPSRGPQTIRLNWVG
jgi:hypothetical protein